MCLVVFVCMFDNNNVHYLKKLWYEHRVIVYFQVQIALFSERWTYQNIMVFITFFINIAQRTYYVRCAIYYIIAIQVNVLIYW